MNKDATQEDRMAMLVGMKLLFVTSRPFFDHAYGSQSGFILDAKRWGFDVHVVLDVKDDDLYMKLKRDGVLPESGDNVLFVAMEDDQENISQNIIAEIKKHGLVFDGIYTTNEHAMLYVGEILSLLKDSLYPFANDFACYEIAKDKFKTRTQCEAMGLRVPKYYLIQSESDLELIPFMENNGSPQSIDDPLLTVIPNSYCLKPTAGGNSAGVYFIGNRDELVMRYRAIEKELISDPYMSYGNKGKQTYALLEEFIDGKEYDVDILMADGKVVYSELIDNWPTELPYFLETGSNLPTIDSDDRASAIKNYAIECVVACGFTMGCFHVEVKYSEVYNEPILIEVNSRMGGGRTRELHNRVYNVDLLLESIMVHCGIPISPPKASAPLTNIAEYELSSKISGTLLNNNYLDHLSNNPNVLYYKYSKNAGSIVRGTDVGIPNWLSHLIVSAESPTAAVSIMQDIIANITIPIATPVAPHPENEIPKRARRRSSSEIKSLASISNNDISGIQL